MLHSGLLQLCDHKGVQHLRSACDEDCVRLQNRWPLIQVSAHSKEYLHTVETYNIAWRSCTCTIRTHSGHLSIGRVLIFIAVLPSP